MTGPVKRGMREAIQEKGKAVVSNVEVARRALRTTVAKLLAPEAPKIEANVSALLDQRPPVHPYPGLNLNSSNGRMHANGTGALDCATAVELPWDELRTAWAKTSIKTDEFYDIVLEELAALIDVEVVGLGRFVGAGSHEALVVLRDTTFDVAVGHDVNQMTKKPLERSIDLIAQYRPRPTRGPDDD